ncbi:unnamed protein product [Mytilus edulis]|uniref:Endonuclease/exonuclease/phosphatase domain-containing protein n=1 Tax=Mytilus edulis TaxID=6550 RepID=A0A8S3T5J4_MYTED|nr:unnamed protein product [Mytilus edulis]
MIKERLRTNKNVSFCDNSNMSYKGEALPRFIDDKNGFHLAPNGTAVFASNINILDLPKRVPRKQNGNRETHAGYDSCISFENFQYYPFCRSKSKNNRYFGGLCILIRNNFRKGVKFQNDGTSEYQWLKLLYYAPKGSIDLIEILEKDIIEKYGKKEEFILLGDFNARTGNDCDFIEGDNTTHIPLNNSNYNIDILNERRASCDNTVDFRGKDLLDFCICNQIRILNGRILGNSTGKHTCFKYNGCSVVDYVLASEQLFCNILYMCVSDFKATFSDCHCKLSFKLLASFTNENIYSNLKDFPTRYEWNEENLISFQNAFAHPAIQNELKNFITEDISFDSADLNRATKTIHSLSEKNYNKISEAELNKAFKKLKSDKSPGLDNISNDMLKGIYPSEWSKSFICPIFKDDRKKPENYRGIAINNSIGKLFNIILKNLFLDK